MEVKKAVCYKKLFRPFTAKIFQNLGIQSRTSKVFLKHFFLTVGQNNFDNNIVFLGPRFENQIRKEYRTCAAQVGYILQNRSSNLKGSLYKKTQSQEIVAEVVWSLSYHQVEIQLWSCACCTESMFFL